MAGERGSTQLEDDMGQLMVANEVSVIFDNDIDSDDGVSHYSETRSNHTKEGADGTESIDSSRLIKPRATEVSIVITNHK